jgi:hypothetical protein
MNVLLALAVGYVIGARTGGKDLDQLGRALKSLAGTDEFGEVVLALRAQVGATLHEVAAIVQGERPVPDESVDLVARVRHLTGRD